MKEYNQYLKEEKENLIKTKILISKIGCFIAFIVVMQVIRFFTLHKLSYLLMLSTLLSMLFLFVAIKNQKANMKVARMNEKEIEKIKKEKLGKDK